MLMGAGVTPVTKQVRTLAVGWRPPLRLLLDNVQVYQSFNNFEPFAADAASAKGRRVLIGLLPGR
jgi:hypothetical protein